MPFWGGTGRMPASCRGAPRAIQRAMVSRWLAVSGDADPAGWLPVKHPEGLAGWLPVYEAWGE